MLLVPGSCLDGLVLSGICSRNRHSRGREGTSLLELLGVVVTCGVALSVAVGFAGRQEAAVDGAVEQRGAIESLNRAITALEQDLTALGADALAGRRLVVHVSSDRVVFGGSKAPDEWRELVSGRPAIDVPVAHAGGEGAHHRRLHDAGASAEVVALYFAPDTFTARPDDYVFVRQVGGGTPEVLARHLLRVDGLPFLSHERLDGGGRGGDVGIAASMFHASEGMEAGAVRLSARASNGLRGSDERTIDASRLISFGRR